MVSHLTGAASDCRGHDAAMYVSLVSMWFSKSSPFMDSYIVNEGNLKNCVLDVVFFLYEVKMEICKFGLSDNRMSPFHLYNFLFPCQV